jgi:hypothetical protein
MRIDSEGDRAMLARVRGPREPRPWLPLLNAVLALAGNGAELVSHGERPWASATFAGTRHSVALAFQGNDGAAAADAFIAALPDHEFTMRGKLVADATIILVEQVYLPTPSVTVEAELLVLDDA